MDADAVLDAVRDDRETELSRLGSSKSLYAATGGEMEAGAVRAAVAAVAAAGAETYADWAEAATGPAEELFADAAAAERERHAEFGDGGAGDGASGGDGDDAGEGDGAGGDGDGGTGADDPPAPFGHLRGVTGTPERVGGLLGATLALDAVLSQTVGFFVGDADPRTASTVRSMRGTVEDRIDAATATLDAVCADDADYDRAREAADAAVGAAYEEYVTNLEAMGVNPKPVC